MPAHAAVSETVGLAPNRVRGFVNAVLRRVAATPMVWPSELTRLSYPDWIGELLIDELGAEQASSAMVRMNEPAPVTTRSDGYVQDLSSQWVAAAVETSPGDSVLDVCAAPGGKATAIAAEGARVTAADVRPNRASLVAANATRLDADVVTVVADATRQPFRGTLFRRRADRRAVQWAGCPAAAARRTMEDPT